MCMVNIVRIKADDYVLPMSLGPNGEVNVDFKGINFILDSEYGLTLEDGDCTYQVKYENPTAKQSKGKSDQRFGSVNCNSWEQRSR
ncbi:unnamed protein product [Trichobilharzia szidati]|nr:unnamed protein product [Trichobilharzia szidati]